MGVTKLTGQMAAWAARTAKITLSGRPRDTRIAGNNGLHGSFRTVCDMRLRRSGEVSPRGSCKVRLRRTSDVCSGIIRFEHLFMR
jgi:hypothetical protein